MKLIMTYPDGFQVQARTPAGLVRQLRGRSPFTEQQGLREYMRESSRRYQILGYRVRTSVLGYLLDLHMHGLATIEIKWNE